MGLPENPTEESAMPTINTARIDALPDDYFADKRFTREDLANALRALADELESPAVAEVLAAPLPTKSCGVQGRNGVCLKPRGHGQRHRYGRPPVSPHRPVDRPWVPVTTIQVSNEDATRQYAVKVPGVCSVWDDDTHRRKTNGWEILSAERHRETGVVNVTVRQGRNGRARTVRLSRLVYRRPKGK